MISKKSMLKTILKFKEKLDWPPWYRGVSGFQKSAANELLSVIRDDTEQGTAYRVRACLANIGVNPLVSDRQIKVAMRLSRGNDLAFLWFLMELYYKDSCKKCTHIYYGYSVNEQLILSLIAHLDMVTTLKALDIILPPGVPLHVNSDAMTTKKAGYRKKGKNVPKPQYVLPYFEKLRRPVAFAHPPLAPHDRPLFRHYPEHMNPNHVVLNEANRWYADYELSKTKRAALHIINQVLNDIFSEEYKAQLRTKEPIMCSKCATHWARSDEQQIEKWSRDIATLTACMDRYDPEIFRKKNALNRYQKGIAKPMRCACMDEPVVEINKCRKEMDEAYFEEYINKYDYGHGEGIKLSCSDHYFTAPQPHKPLKFDHMKVLNARPINDPIKKAIDEEMRFEFNQTDRPPDRVDLNASVNDCFKTIWRETVRIRNEQDEKTWQAFMEEEKTKWKSPIGYKEGYYDPRNDVLMDKMLYDGLKFMRKNPKFVLASLPDAHKTPILREWIRWRYGKIYTKKEQLKDVEVSQKIFKIMKQIGMSVPVPKSSALGTKRVISYRCREYLIDKTKQVMEGFYHEFKMTHLEEVRILWGAVASYKSTKISLAPTFFAYLPSNADEILMFKPWQPSEYMDAITEWNKRREARLCKCGTQP